MLFRKWLFDLRILILPFILFCVHWTHHYDLIIHFRYITFILIGTIYYLMREKRVTPEIGIFSVVLIFGLLIVMPIPDHPETPFWRACLWSQACAILVFFGAASFPWLTQNRILTFFAQVSYPLYLIHGINGYILMLYLHRLHIPPLLISFLGSSGVVLLAYILHRLFEEPLLKYSKELSAVFPRRG